METKIKHRHSDLLSDQDHFFLSDLFYETIFVDVKWTKRLRIVVQTMRLHTVRKKKKLRIQNSRISFNFLINLLR